ncbi:hypothetical protein PPYR_10174 [Photinus pyralis]|uniref:protein xylosyltransferase n=1 Tax=Photinus pyralis TaxID=7054 RepID=A0A5N4AFL0_PHOPY|nr:xylosyltransferase oxt isoform X1 [Photinus pyralis]KAB0796113.1 hypothetical protein PPYR_10174 [Photinus pyralis]
MVVTKTSENRWLRRYRICFFIGVLILSFQIYLAVRFFRINVDNADTSGDYNSFRLSNFEINDVENSVNSARRSKDSFSIDDEDISNSFQAKPKRDTVINKTQNKNQLHLRLEELDFVPACKITTKEAISAIHRAKTQKCKQTISNITCLISADLLYPKELPNYCPNDGFVAGKSLGCFKDEKSFRLLNGHYGNYKNANSPEFCMHLCLQSGFLYAGVQYSSECFCGNEEPSPTSRLPDSSCNMKCPADPHLACGGYYTVNVYQTGIAKFSPQVAETTVSPSVRPARIVFLLTLNGRALRQVRRLIRILYHRDHYFYIHVDVRQDYLFRELLSLETQFPNIRLTRKRFCTIWGGASLLQMLLSSMHELLLSRWEWDFVINLSESDYPVKTGDKLVEFLTANKGKNFVKSHGREVQRFIQKQGLDKTFVECDTHMWRIGDRKLPWGIQIDGGSDWIALSREFVTYAASDEPDELVKGLRIVFNYTLLPAESFFHTVLKNSKFCNSYIDNNLHVTNWKRRLGCKCQYKHIVDWCGCSPNDFLPEDWLRIQNTETRQIFFARKFEPVINQAVVLQLEQWLYNVNFNKDIPNINSYWQSVYHHLDLTPSPDDSLLTVAQSIIRINSKLISDKCRLIPEKILEMTSFHADDIYQKTLILYVANDTGAAQKVTVETNFKYKTTFVLLKSSPFLHRLKSLTVSTEYDPKEQTFRNFAHIMGPYSEPTLVFEFNSSPELAAKSTNITFLWIDPVGRLADVHDVSIDDNYALGHIKPALKQPLLPGAWTVKLIHKQVLAEMKFLIAPLEFFSGNVVTQKQVGFVHSGSEIIKEFDVQWGRFLPNGFDRETLLSKSIADSKRFGADLRDWIDSLVNKFFSIGSSCASDRSTVCTRSFDECGKTNWSSFAPDPKSSLNNL